MEIIKILGNPLATPVIVLSGIVHKGAYAAGTDYAVGDVVSYNGASYVMYVDAVAGTAPTDATKWQVLSSPQQYVESIGELALVNATTDNTLSVDQNGNVGTDVATDGAVHIENTGNTGIGLGVYTNIGATADAPLVSIKANNAAFDQNAVTLVNEGVGIGQFIDQNGNGVGLKIDSEATTTTKYGLEIYMSAGAIGFFCRQDGDYANAYIYHLGTGAGVNLTLEGKGTGTNLFVNQDNTGIGIEVDHDDTGTNPSVKIDRDGNNAARIFGLEITVDNAGVGNLVGGIDFSGMSDTEPLFKLPSATPDTDLSTKSPETDAEAGWFPVLVGTTTYAVPIYALS